MKHCNFQVWLSGYGETEQECWQDACQSFWDDPGSPPEEHGKDLVVEKVSSDTYEPIT